MQMNLCSLSVGLATEQLKQKEKFGGRNFCLQLRNNRQGKKLCGVEASIHLAFLLTVTVTKEKYKPPKHKTLLNKQCFLSL